MKRTKEQKGITLVALIITIVVLLILAVVAIGAVGESGIILHTQNAASDYNEAQVNENSAIHGYEGLIDKYANPTSVAENYWYEENENGGITILGPKKILILDDNKVNEKLIALMIAEYGEETSAAFLNGTLETENEELYYEILARAEYESNKVIYNFSNNECWVERDLTKEEATTPWWVEKVLNWEIVRLYNNEKLPDYIDGKPVTRIANYAFYYVHIINGEFLPNTVKEIGEEAFRSCLFESKLVIPDSVEIIRAAAFDDPNFKPKIEVPFDPEQGIEYEDVTLIMNDAKGNLKSIERHAFACDHTNGKYIGTLTLRSEIDINGEAFKETEVTIIRK